MAEFDPKRALAPIDLANEPVFEIGGVTVRPTELALQRNGERRKLQPRVMKVLVALWKARPRVVSRDELIELCWGGRVVGDDALNRCISALRHLAKEFTPVPFVIETVPRVGHRLVGANSSVASSAVRPVNPLWRSLGAAAAVLAILALLLAKPWDSSPRIPAVQVISSANDAASIDLAQDLRVKLATVQSVPSTSIRLMGDGASSSSKPDLVIQVRRAAGPSIVGANAVLIARRGNSVLWSQEFEQPSRNPADLKQQVAFTTARVLRCAVEGMGAEDPLSEPDLKAYLGACAALSKSGADARTLVPALEAIVSKSPQFVRGWATLLEAETAALNFPGFPQGATLKATLRRHIAIARKLEPHLAEAYIAEHILVPQWDFPERSQLVDAAVSHNPDHAEARVDRALFLLTVGRVSDALRDSREAVRLDPLSPNVRDGYITTLAIAGRLDLAREELAKSERLWPGAGSMLLARYRLGLRFGDARDALRLLRSGRMDPMIWPHQEAFLVARIDPSPKNVERAINQWRLVFESSPEAIDQYAQTLAEFDHKEELLEILLTWHRPDMVEMITGVLFRPAFTDVHRDPRFMRATDHLGLLDYWRRTGKWPDFCFVADLPYDCKVEAAKLESKRESLPPSG